MTVLVIVACSATLAATLSGSQARRRPSFQHAALAPPPLRRATPAEAELAAYALLARIDRGILSYTSYLSVGSARKREVALTFDDGPGPYTPRVLSVLERFHVKATFFEIGRNVHTFPRYTAMLAHAGMAIGDHTEEHPPMARLDAAQQAAQLDEAAAAIQAAGAPWPLLFRPPYGSFDTTTLALLRARDMLMVLWSIDTRDYTLPGVARIVHTALGGAAPGAVILMHDGGGVRTQTIAALPRIIEHLRRRGYVLVTVPELLRDDPPPQGQPPPVNLAGD